METQGAVHKGFDLLTPLLRLIKPKANAELLAKEQTKKAEDDDLLLRVAEIQKRLAAMQSAFECEKDFDAIEVYIYEITALELQYASLIKLAKRQNIKASINVLSC